MAGGMLTKQDVFLTARYLNDVNDTAAGGAVLTLPPGAPVPYTSQTIPGDRIVLDDITAKALSDTTVGTLYGGIYMYVGTLSSSTAAPAVGTGAFYRAADLPPAFTAPLYQVTADASPTAAIPTFLAGVFINAATKGNYCWIQTAGVVSCLFDSAVTGALTVGNPVTVKITANVASTFDVSVPLAATLAAAIAAVDTLVGMAIVAPAVSTVSAVLWTRTPFPRI